MATVLPQELEEVLGLLADARTTNGLAVAALTAVVLDHIVTFPDEVNLIWTSRWNIAKIAYIWIRYFTLLVLCVYVYFMLKGERSDRLCGYFSMGEIIISTIIVVSADFIMILRVWILYGRSRRLLYFMVLLIAAEIVAMITLGAYTIIKPIKEFVHVGSLLGGCYTLQVPRLFACYAVPPFLTAIIMFSMTAFKCGSTLMTLGPKRTPIITLFMRDGVFWFLAVLLLSTLEIVLWASARPTLAQIPVVPLTALVAIIAARVVLNIKQVASNNLIWDVEATID